MLPAQAGMLMMASAALSGSGKRGAAAVPKPSGQALPPRSEAAEVLSAKVLCVDLDGTLVNSNTLVEAALAFIRLSPTGLPRLIFWSLRGQANLWKKLAEVITLDPASLPYREDVVRFVRAEQKRRRVVLVTGAHSDTANAVAGYLGGFSQVFATCGNSHLTGARKRDLLARMYGAGQFDYLGDSFRDIPAWEQAGTAYVAVRQPRLLKALRRRTIVPLIVGENRESVWRNLARALRIHQWSKSLLVFAAPALGHVHDLHRFVPGVGAFLCFCVASSSVYLMNDLLDLEADRAHATKRHRPLASGRFPLSQAALVAVILAFSSLGIAAMISTKVGLLILGYLLSASAYSLGLKRLLVIDIMLLAGFYLLRLFAGGVASGVKISFWTLLFSLFLFMSLALMKRCSELKNSNGSVRVVRRNYQTEDLPALSALGTCTSLAAVLVIALYINSPDVRVLYRTPDALWLMCPVFLAWCSRLWILTGRGEMNEDPVSFSLRDRWSQISGLAIAAIFSAAL
jgi:4-hydroxybenzoate polyprenyltransferase/phosphoglycolate phosphatase-like HAD superfamily hydrolase